MAEKFKQIPTAQNLLGLAVESPAGQCGPWKAIGSMARPPARV